jgi:hypothetical protein
MWKMQVKAVCVIWRGDVEIWQLNVRCEVAVITGVGLKRHYAAYHLDA